MGVMTEHDGEPTTREPGAQGDWWHRDHPVFTRLAGFFTGLAFVALVPALYAAILRSVVSDETAKSLFPFVLVMLAVPLGLVISERTRLFGKYLLFGMLLCTLVVVGVATLVLWVLATLEG